MTPEEQAAADEASKVEEAEILKKEEETVSKEQYDTEVARLDAEKEKWKHRFQKNEKKYDEAKKST